MLKILKFIALVKNSNLGTFVVLCHVKNLKKIFRFRKSEGGFVYYETYFG